MLYNIKYVITCVMLCYITCVMLGDITCVMFCYVMLYTIKSVTVRLYNIKYVITCVMLCYITYIRYVMLYNMFCYVI